MADREYNPQNPVIPTKYQQTVYQFIFGNPCLICRRTTKPSPAFPGLCRSCLKSLPWRHSDCALPWPAPVIEHLSEALPAKIQSLANRQLSRDAIILTVQNSRIWVACRYETPIREGLLALKFADASEWSHVFAALLAALLTRLPEHFDAIVAVPLHSNRLAERGYNQAGLIAAALAKRCGITDWSHQLVRTRATARQSEQKQRADRFRNLSGAFIWLGAQDLRSTKILLIDDVLTTGATLGTAAATLFAAGARVTGLVVASNQTLS